MGRLARHARWMRRTRPGLFVLVAVEEGVSLSSSMLFGLVWDVCTLKFLLVLVLVRGAIRLASPVFLLVKMMDVWQLFHRQDILIMVLVMKNVEKHQNRQKLKSRLWCEKEQCVKGKTSRLLRR